MVSYCPRCEQHVNLNDINEEKATYYQCEMCFMILCWEKKEINLFNGGRLITVEAD
jgi:hypothetical protein